MSAMDADKSFSFVLRNDDKMKEGQFAYVQLAMLYGTFFGERRIRVFNYQVPIAKNLNNYFKSADAETLTSFLVKQELARSLQKGAKTTREAMTN